MRLPVILRPLMVVMLAALPLAAAAAEGACEKEVFVYFDVSTSMRMSRGGVTRLEIFARAVDELLTHASDFLAEGDRVRLVTFSRTTHVPYDEEIARDADALSRLRAELMQLRALKPDPKDHASRVTDVTLVLSDLEEALTDRRTYVIVASDLIHDPNGENAANQPARKEAFLQRLTDFVRNVHGKPLPEIIVLDANVAGDVDADVGREITRAFAAAPLSAESIRVTGLQTVMRQLKRQIGKPMEAAVVLRSEGGSVRLALQVTNPNAFPVRLLRTKAGDETVSTDLLIGCGGTRTIDITAPAGTRITAEFDVGDVAPPVVPGDALDIDATGARVLVDTGGKGTLLLHVNVRKFLHDDAIVEVEVVDRTKTTVSISKGVADERVTFAIPLSSNAVQLRSEETVHARFSVSKTIDLQQAGSDGDKRSREDTAETDRDGRDLIRFVCRFLAILLVTALLPSRGVAKLVFDSALDAEILNLLPGPSRFLSAGYAGGYFFLPAYLLSGPRWIAYVNALPTALLAAMSIFYALRFVSLFVWARAIEPKGRVLPARKALLQLRRLSIAIWVCTLLTLVAVAHAMASLVPNALVAAQ